jgi:hypothetical protein
MQASAARLAAGLAQQGSGQEVDIWHELGRMTLDVVGSAAFGCAAPPPLLLLLLLWGIATCEAGPGGCPPPPCSPAEQQQRCRAAQGSAGRRR